jgi:hypothetical protein
MPLEAPERELQFLVATGGALMLEMGRLPV